MKIGTETRIGQSQLAILSRISGISQKIPQSRYRYAISFGVPASARSDWVSCGVAALFFFRYPAAMTTWTRKKTRIGNQTAPNDWTIYANGFPCGRVHPVPSPLVNMRDIWFWSCWCNPSASGRTDSFEQALEQIRVAVIRADGRMSGRYADIKL